MPLKHRFRVSAQGCAPIYILHYRKVEKGRYDSIVVMPQNNDTGSNLEEQLEGIDRHLQEIRHTVVDILRSVQDELQAMRERELWRQDREANQEE